MMGNPANLKPSEPGSLKEQSNRGWGRPRERCRGLGEQQAEIWTHIKTASENM